MPVQRDSQEEGPACGRGRWIVFTPLAKSRVAALSLGVAGAVQVGCTLAGITTFHCPLLHLVGVPCPGCGISRGSAEFLRGHWSGWIDMHLFAPLFLAAIVILLVLGLMPAEHRSTAVNHLARVESRTHLPALLLAIIILYWIVRLSYGFSAFSHRMAVGG
jgi:hypothetical protein